MVSTRAITIVVCAQSGLEAPRPDADVGCHERTSVMLGRFESMVEVMPAVEEFDDLATSRIARVSRQRQRSHCVDALAGER